MKDNNRFDQADKLSERIIDLVNRELRADCSPLQILAGQLLALASFLQTMPEAPTPPPVEFRVLQQLVHDFLRVIAMYNDGRES